jgi:lipoprotein signal peptidase
VTLNYWPTFNFADACVTIGVVIVIISMLFAPTGVSGEPGPGKGPA